MHWNVAPDALPLSARIGPLVYRLRMVSVKVVTNIVHVLILTCTRGAQTLVLNPRGKS